MFSACSFADTFLDHITVGTELIACIQKANENAGNLISVVQFLIIIFIHKIGLIYSFAYFNPFPLKSDTFYSV